MESFLVRKRCVSRVYLPQCLAAGVDKESHFAAASAAI